MAVNPDVIRAQMEGGIGFGHALYAEITLDQGRPVQTNVDTYRSLRIHEKGRSVLGSAARLGVSPDWLYKHRFRTDTTGAAHHRPRNSAI